MADRDKVTAALSSHRHCFTFLAGAACPPTLLSALQRFLTHIEPSTWPERLGWGGTYLNGIRVLHDRPITAPCRIEYFEPKIPHAENWAEVPALPPQHIIFEDEDLLAVFKPAHLSTLPTREQVRFNLRHILEEHLRRNNSNATLHLPSRIDTSACGLVLASKSPRMHRALQRVFERRQIHKIYRLRSACHVSWETTTVDFPIGRESEHPVLRRAYMADDPANRTKPALTHFRLLKKHCDGSLIEARPVTGRTHQIRVHSSSAGFPIAGDKFYGGAPAEQLNLLSFRADFPHPLSFEPMTMEVPRGLVPSWALSD